MELLLQMNISSWFSYIGFSNKEGKKQRLAAYRGTEKWQNNYLGSLSIAPFLSLISKLIAVFLVAQTTIADMLIVTGIPAFFTNESSEEVTHSQKCEPPPLSGSSQPRSLCSASWGVAGWGCVCPSVAVIQGTVRGRSERLQVSTCASRPPSCSWPHCNTAVLLMYLRWACFIWLLLSTCLKKPVISAVISVWLKKCMIDSTADSVRRPLREENGVNEQLI